MSIAGGRRAESRSFVARMMASLALALVLVGALQYALVARTLSQTALRQMTTAHTGDASVLRDLYDAGGGLPAVGELLNHMASRPDVADVALVGHDGTVRAVGVRHHGGTAKAPHGAAASPEAAQRAHGEKAQPAHGEAARPAHGETAPESTHGDTAPEPAHGQTAPKPAHGDAAQPGHGQAAAPNGGHTPGAASATTRTVGATVDAATRSSISDVVARDEPFSQAHVTELDGKSVIRVPVTLGGQPHVLEVFRKGADLREQVSDLREVLLLTLAAGLVLALPVFYAIGGRALSARHGQAVEGSTTDGLTGLANHRTFHEDLRRAIDLARRHGRPLSIALVDLDGFKQVNDTHGHRTGDRVLSSVGLVLRQGRPGDTAYRIGGDEFAVILPETSTDGALIAAERIRAEVDAGIDGVTTSIGVATLGVSAPDAESLVQRTDTALYAAKHRGKNRVVPADDVRTPQPEALHP
ncbi:MAG: diguanylate cyclase [Actinomycetota bacterium]|nr:diguanylate cyclase [Actinomycetota bacterium]